MSIQSFGDAATEDVYDGNDTRTARRLPQILWPAIRRKLDMLNAAHELGDLRAPPGNRLERLRGDKSGRYSIRVNDQFRITFRFEDGNCHEVNCEDYH
jgi:proteic killer suppression protein